VVNGEGTVTRSVFFSTFVLAAALAPIVLQSNDCSLSPYPKLSRLELYVPDVNGQDVISGFRPEGILYRVELPLQPSATAVLVVQAEDPTSTIEATYNDVPIGLDSNGEAPLALAGTHTEIRVTLTSADRKGMTYTVSIDRLDPCHWESDAAPCADFRGRCWGGLCNYVPVNVSVGSKEVVFDWTVDRCEDLDLPDNEAHPVRAEDGSLVLFSNNGPTNYVSRGPDFDALERDCESAALVSADSRSPETYENWEWLWSPYRQGSSWHMLIHNEFHDTVSPTCDVGNPAPGNPCWYNAITYAVSNDGGRTFVKPSPPTHVVAPHPTAWAPPPPNWPVGPVYVEGYMNPSNIIRGPQGYYYSMIRSVKSIFTSEYDWCPMRTDTLSDPSSWRAWDGTGFSLHMQSPYVTYDPIPLCTTLHQSFQYSSTATLTFNTYLERYMLLFNAPQTVNGEEVCGHFFAPSIDLIHWSDPQLITKIQLPWCSNPPSSELLEPVWVLYPSMIDHADSTTNFERPGRTPYLYYTRFNNEWGLDRDLVRVPLQFTIAGALCEGVDCDDQDQCTDDLCNGAGGACEHTPRDCDDSNDCTVDSCNPAIGCEHTVAENGAPCQGATGTCQDGSCSVVFPCTEEGILNAIVLGGGPHTFNCATPTTVVTTAEIVINNDVVLDGGGNLTVQGNGAHRVFSVATGVSAGLMNLVVTGGSTSDVGGGILNAGALSLTDVAISGNTAANIGGGISNQPGASATLVRAVVEGNNVTNGSGGGIGGTGTITLTDTIVRGNQVRWHGGGVFHNGSMALANSTVSGNTATYGGGLFTYPPGSLTLINSTVSGNSATDAGGGGIVNEGTMTLVSTTIAANSAAQIGTAISNLGSASLRNTIVAGDCWLAAAVDSLGGNIESEGNTCGFGPEDQILVPAPSLGLQPLGDHGGRTPTHALLAPSAAIDRVDPAQCIDVAGQTLTNDQRGVSRPQGALCDVGSVEAFDHCEGVDCDDQNDCTEDQCDAATGICGNNPLPNGSGCDFGGVPGLCENGRCASELCAGVDCTYQCVLNDCDPETGVCIPVADGSACNLFGVGDGICFQGECVEPT
jgi:hypothetical protein